MKITCPGCSTGCQINVPIPKLPFDFPAIPAIPAIPTLPEIPELPEIPTPAEILAKATAFVMSFAGELPTFSYPEWQAHKTYVENEVIQVLQTVTPGALGVRKTILSYRAKNSGIGGDGTITVITSTGPVATPIVWGVKEVIDGEVTLVLIAKTSGVSGQCPSSEGASK